MADNLTEAKRFAAKRAQAERNVKTRINAVLLKAAGDIARAAQGITLVSSETMFSQMVAVRAKNVIEDAENEINRYIREYSKASITVLGDKDTGATTRLLNSELFGKTFMQRSHTYMAYFLNDVVKMVIAGRKLKMKQSAIENSVAKQFQDPYTNGIIEKANRRGANIMTPAYGRGIYRSAYGNIVRNAQGTISVAWGREDRNFHKRQGAVAFRVRRGSSFPCPLCDNAAEGTHNIDERGVVPPLHVNCVCYVEYIYNS